MTSASASFAAFSSAAIQLDSPTDTAPRVKGATTTPPNKPLQLTRLASGKLEFVLPDNPPQSGGTGVPAAGQPLELSAGQVAPGLRVTGLVVH